MLREWEKEGGKRGSTLVFFSFPYVNKLDLVQKVIAFGDFLWLGYYENLLF
jgi:hypothetical protein